MLALDVPLSFLPLSPSLLSRDVSWGMLVTFAHSSITTTSSLTIVMLEFVML